MKLTTHLHLVSKLKILEVYLHSPIRLHGLVLNKLSAGTMLPFYNNHIFLNFILLIQLALICATHILFCCEVIV
jgi:hypothetical protein